MSNQLFAPVVKSIAINASPSDVWKFLTTLDLMQQWMSDTVIKITTDWTIGSPFIIEGDSYKTGFINTGKVLQCEMPHVLAYSHLSSLSRLPDKVENYTEVWFRLEAKGEHTFLEVTLKNFPTESIYRHFDFYWGVTVEVLKKAVEEKSMSTSGDRFKNLV